MRKYKVVSIHYTNRCNMKCPFCYKRKMGKSREKPLKFWCELVPYIKRLSNQIALGGGEPFTNIPFIKKFGKICKKNKVMLNVTSNGRLLMDLSDKKLKEVLKDITMISLSYDNYKIKDSRDLVNYLILIRRIKQLTETQVGSNLLINENMFKNEGKPLINIADLLFKSGIDRIFALCPKNMPCPDVLKFKDTYAYLTIKYKNFFVDDLGKMILQEGKYSEWKHKCHRGKDLISLNEDGGISSCSFAKPFVTLKEPKDILNIRIPKSESGTDFCPFCNQDKDLNICSFDT